MKWTKHELEVIHDFARPVAHRAMTYYAAVRYASYALGGRTLEAIRSQLKKAVKYYGR